MSMLAGWQFDFTNPVLTLASFLLLVSLLATLLAVRKRLFHRKPLRALLTMLLNVIAFGTLFPPHLLRPVEIRLLVRRQGLAAAFFPEQATRFIEVDFFLRRLLGEPETHGYLEERDQEKCSSFHGTNMEPRKPLGDAPIQILLQSHEP